MITKFVKPLILMKLLLKSLFCIFLINFVSSCSNQPSDQTLGQSEIRSDSLGSKIQAKKLIKYAQNIDIQDFGLYQLLTIYNSSKETQDSLQYVLINKNQPKPKHFTDNQIITIPIKDVICLSGTQVGMIDEMGQIKSVIGITNKNYVANPVIQQRVSEGKTLEVGEANMLNEELILSLNPDVILVSSGIGNSMPILEKMQKLGIKILVTADWLENTPLGRAEWLKLIGILYNSKNEAERKFKKIEANYLMLTQQVKHLPKPTVITDVPYKGTWYLPAGESYMAHFLADAGADYYKKSTKGTGSIPTDFEEIYSQNLKADFWINLGHTESKEMMLNTDRKLADFKAFQEDKLYSYHRRKTETGAYEYFESSITKPDVVLADLIKIFHPEILPNHTFYYYKKLK